ncbi:type I-E CRISPR-associated protein Cse2/CasB [Paucibacter sp. PLA-PC-4]|uniref:type I-E CRISPR-associated protein Cse2/CasB n=1 Tax=Paucibacter sp. PLA-PC-4 TaxID=2993655 RepID=UPI00224A67EC|nr:type I-E CRISPR-associated protein Cse2/CasB [Paucibacter sp. PLA-PC-4]MCX2865656.1 type I-E CRISPR-associated protein Cse2/CasB [Paucibacter sp. PLA-PC-4]
MSNRNPDYTLASPVMSAYLSWWRAISSEKANGTARADRAELRRAHDLSAVAMTPAYQRFYRKLVEAGPDEKWKDWQLERLAAIAGLAVHIKSDSSLNLPEAMSHRDKGSDRNPVSELRFARLLDAPDVEALFSGLRRVMPLIDKQLNPAALANDLFGWGEQVKKQWAYAYAWPPKP